MAKTLAELMAETVPGLTPASVFPPILQVLGKQFGYPPGTLLEVVKGAGFTTDGYKGQPTVTIWKDGFQTKLPCQTPFTATQSAVVSEDGLSVTITRHLSTTHPLTPNVVNALAAQMILDGMGVLLDPVVHLTEPLMRLPHPVWMKHSTCLWFPVSKRREMAAMLTDLAGVLTRTGAPA